VNDSFLKEITILVAEDSDSDRSILTDTLKKYFPNTLEASNGEEAYELYRANKKIDIIISDIDMPKISGMELLKLVRKSDIHLPFIFTTAKVETTYILEAINHNISSYLVKPIDLRVLLEKIDFLCEKKYYELRLSKKQEEVENYIEAVDKAALIYKMTEDGDISYMNSAMLDISGYTQSDVKSLNFSHIIHPDIPQKYIDQTWEHVKSGKLWKGNTKFVSKDKETFYLNNTIFKINNEKEEYITIAFLTTKENLEKRDFHKKVLLKFQEANKREYELKKALKEMSAKLKNTEALYLQAQDSLNSLKEKSMLKERQLKHYELQGDNLTQKYEKFMSAKKEELETYIKSLKIEKQKNEQLVLKEEELLDTLETMKARYENIDRELSIKNARIRDLTELLSLQDEEPEEISKTKRGFFNLKK